MRSIIEVGATPGGGPPPTGEAPSTGTAEPPADTVGEVELARLLTVVEQAEALQAEAVALAGRLAGAGVAERTQGLPLDLLLAAEAGLTGGDRHMLLTAGQVLATMPRLAAAHRAGTVSWGQVRAVVALVRRRSRADRAMVDARIGATLDGHVPIDRSEPDAFVESVAEAVDALTARRAVEQREQRQVAANRLWAQLGLDGRVHGGFAYDAASAATVLDAIAAAQGRPATDDADREPHVPTPQQQSAAAALLGICKAHLAGCPGHHATGDASAGERGNSGGAAATGDAEGAGPGNDGGVQDVGGAGAPGGCGGRRARPAYVVDVKLSDLTEAGLPGRLRLPLPGARPGVSLRRLADDALAGARVRVVLSAGAAPLAASIPVATDAAGLDLTAGRAWAAAHGVPPARQSGVAALVAAIARALGQPDLACAAAGQRPLCDAALLTAEDVPTATRAAVLARDGGCRFFGCAAPIAWCDVHHLDDRPSGRRQHHPDRLVALCRRCHRRVHLLGWTLHLDPPSGRLTGCWTSPTGTVRRWHTMPRGSPLAAGPDSPSVAPARRDGASRSPPASGPDDLPF